MRTTETKELPKTEVETNLKELFVLWKQTSRNGLEYLSGKTSEIENPTKLISYFNTNKRNPKEPDIRVYATKEGQKDIEVATLWENVSDSKGTRYLTGLSNDNEKLVAFYGKENEEKRPYIKCYIKENK